MKFSDATLLTFALGAAAQLGAVPANNNNINAGPFQSQQQQQQPPNFQGGNRFGRQGFGRGPFAKRDITDAADAIDTDEVADAVNQVTGGHQLVSREPHFPHYNPGFGGFGGPGFGPRHHGRYHFGRRAQFGPPINAGFGPSPYYGFGGRPNGFGGPGFGGRPNGFGGPGFGGQPNGFGGPGFGAPVFKKRDVTTVSGVIMSLNSGLKSVTTALTSLTLAGAYSDSANSAQEDGFEYAAKQVVNEAYVGQPQIQASPMLGTDEAKQVQGQLDSLQKTGNDLVTALTTAQANIQAVGMCDEVIQHTGEMVYSIRPLLDAIAAKVPSMTSAAQTPNNFVSALELKLSQFTTGGCINRDNLDFDNVNPF